MTTEPPIVLTLASATLAANTIINNDGRTKPPHMSPDTKPYSRMFPDTKLHTQTFTERRGGTRGRLARLLVEVCGLQSLLLSLLRSTAGAWVT